MKFLTRLKIGPRLGLGFATVLALTVIVGMFSVNRLGKVNESTTDLATNWLPAMRALGEYREGISATRRSESLYVMEDQPEVFIAELKRLDNAKRVTASAWKDYLVTLTPGEEEKFAKNIELAQATYYASLARVLAVPRDEGFQVKAKSLSVGESKAAFDAVMATIDHDVDFQTKGGDIAYQDAEKSYSQTRWAVIGLLITAVAVGTGLALFITRSITRPIGRALVVAETVTAGDLSSQIDSDCTDEPGLLLAALKRMNESLVTIVSQVRNGAESIATGSVQIANGNADLSQRTEEQASNLEQTAASMEELTATVNQNADTARQATQLASDASQAATDGGKVVSEVVNTMQAISESSRKIVEIIGTIDSIAFQTNILALNAAVEAARAGEQGRGFAVVASEVRSLAQRSAEAAKQIKNLIGESVEKVENGSKLVDAAGQSMDGIVSRVKRVNDLIQEISAASREQSLGISQVGEAVSQLDRVTQQNAALVEESAAAAESLKDQAAQLAQTVSVFRLAGKTGAAPSPKTVAPKAPLGTSTSKPTPVKQRPQPIGRPTQIGSKSKAPPSYTPKPPAPQGSDEWTSF